jgi:NADH-quinone oxidoreductase subunit E
MTSDLGHLRADAEQIIARYPEPRSALLPLLHLVQSVEGYVSEDGIEFCAGRLGLLPAEVQAVATFYTMFRKRPAGEYHIGVCVTTLCAIAGGDAVFAALSRHLGIEDGETTEDGALSLERIACNAACDHAPVVMVGWEFFDGITPGEACRVADDLRAGRPVRPSRGIGPPCTFRQAERVLAGFPDERAGAGECSDAMLAGLRLARREGWCAPHPADLPVRAGEGG